MADTGRCRYDCYQVALKVNISEEDSNIYRNSGQQLFTINKYSDLSSDSCSCSNISLNQTNQNSFVLPDAVILGMDVDRCNYESAVFNMYVRLPCKPKYTYIPELKQIVTRIKSIVNSLAIRDQLLAIFNFNNDNVFPDDVETARFLCPLNTTNIATFITNLRNTISTFLNTPPGAIGADIATFSKLSSDVTALENKNNEVINSDFDNTVFLPQKFTISTVVNGQNKNLVTFRVNPLQNNTVSEGVVSDHHSYEAVRVPCRTVTEESLSRVTCLTENQVDDILLQLSQECCSACMSSDPVLFPNTMRIVFPLSKEIRTVVPDFGTVPNGITNYMIGKKYTKVRLVMRNGWNSSAYPALMCFDKENCSACVEFSLPLDDYNRSGYEQNFGNLNYCGRGIQNDQGCESVSLPNNVLEAFDMLAMARKIDIMGVHKCTEVNLFTFRICNVPYRGFCVDYGNCKVPTVIPDDLAGNGGYRVSADANYSYQFINIPPPNITTLPTTTLPTTTLPTTTIPTRISDQGNRTNKLNTKLNPKLNAKLNYNPASNLGKSYNYPRLEMGMNNKPVNFGKFLSRPRTTLNPNGVDRSNQNRPFKFPTTTLNNSFDPTTTLNNSFDPTTTLNNSFDPTTTLNN
jgi:hypothetical protein